MRQHRNVAGRNVDRLGMHLRREFLLQFRRNHRILVHDIETRFVPLRSRRDLRSEFVRTARLALGCSEDLLLSSRQILRRGEHRALARNLFAGFQDVTHLRAATIGCFDAHLFHFLTADLESEGTRGDRKGGPRLEKVSCKSGEVYIGRRGRAIHGPDQRSALVTVAAGIASVSGFTMTWIVVPRGIPEAAIPTDFVPIAVSVTSVRPN